MRSLHSYPALFCVGLPLATAAFLLPTAAPPHAPGAPPVEVVLLEDFRDNLNEDRGSSGARWGQGSLTFGHGGGSGRLGELHVPSNQTVTLNTDSQVFPLTGQHHAILSNEEPGFGPGQYDPTNPLSWPQVTIDSHGEGFEFSRLELEPGARLVLEGTRPGRIFVRGEVLHEGVIDLSGETPAPHASNSGGDQFNNNGNGQATKDGGLGGDSGPAGGAGGQGADRMDMTNATLPVMINVGGILNPGAVNDGRDGHGIGGQPDGSGGRGGVHWPSILPTFYSANGGNPAFGDAVFSAIPSDANACRIAMVGGAGSGGSHALNGSQGVAISPHTPVPSALTPNAPPPTPGGDNSVLGLEPPGTVSPTAQRNLEFWLDHLRGGSGGGGGGTSIYGSKHNAAQGPNCDLNGGLFPFFDHSAAGGGGGGGALMIAAGRRQRITGVIDCTGGTGGGSTDPGAWIGNCTQSGQIPGQAPDCEMMAAPGGGGAGGAVRLQAPVIELGNGVGRIDVRGGQGGLGAGRSFGGTGGPGLVRLESFQYQNVPGAAAGLAPLVAPYRPGLSSFNTPYDSAAILSVGDWAEQLHRPERFSGAQSCWMSPAGITQASQVTYIDDTPGAPTDLSRLGWNMDVIFDVPGVGRRIFPYRGIPPVDPNDAYDEANYPSALLGGVDFETYLGTTLNHDEPTLDSGSLFAVRFQGVRDALLGVAPCELELDTDVVPGSLTPFVSHPAKLELFGLSSNAMRFAVVFDGALADAAPLVAGRILGITNLRVRVDVN